MDEDAIVELDLSGIDRMRLESICNSMGSLLILSDVLSILAEHNVFLSPVVIKGSVN